MIAYADDPAVPTNNRSTAAHSEHDFSKETVMAPQSDPLKELTAAPRSSIVASPRSTGTNQPANGAQATSAGPEDGAHAHGKPPLPHERDQSAHMTDGIPSRKVQQAAKDVARGLQDTSKSPEMDRAYQRQKGR